MHSLQSLPLEIQFMVIDYLDYASEVNIYGQTCRAINSFADQRLYQHFAKLYSPRGFKRVIENDNVLAVRRLLSAGVKFDRYDGVYRDHRTPFELAVSRGNEDVVHAFVDILGSHNTMSDIYGGAEVLAAAVKNGGTEMLRLLTEMGKSTKAGILHGQCLGLALMEATKKEDLEAVQLVLEAGADPNVKADLIESEDRYQDHEHRMPLFIAAKTKNEAMVRLLLRNGAHLLVAGDINACQIAEICALGGEEMAKLILEEVDIDSKLETLNHDQLNHFFNYAAAIGDESLTERLLGMGCQGEDLDELYGDAETEPWPRFASPLMLAVKRGNMRIIEMIINNEDPLSEQNALIECSDTLATEAAQTDDESMMEMALKVGQKVEQSPVDYAMGTAFLRAIEHGTESMCEFLIQKGALIVEVPDWQRQCRVKAAFRAKKYDIMDRLLDSSGIGPEDPIIGETTMLWEAAKWGPIEGFKRVVKRGVWLEERCQGCRKAVALAAEYQQHEILKFLLDSGFPIDDLYHNGDCFQTLIVRATSGLCSGPLTTTNMLLDIGGESEYGPLDYQQALEELSKRGVARYTNLGLLREGVNPNMRAEIAKSRGDGGISIAKELISRGASPISGSGSQATSLEWALVNRRFALVETFLEGIPASMDQTFDGLPDNGPISDRFPDTTVTSVPLAFIKRLDLELARMSDELENRMTDWEVFPGDGKPKSDFWDLFFTNKAVAKYMSRMNSIRLGKGELLYKRRIDPEIVILGKGGLLFKKYLGPEVLG